MRSKFTRLVCAVFSVLLIFGLSACGDTKLEQDQIIAMNTAVTFAAYGKNAQAGIDAAESVFKSLDSALDPQVTTGTVYAINNAEGGSTVVSGQIANMLSTAKKVYDRSGGSLDITIYPLVELWGFIDNKFYIPTGEEILNTLPLLCFNKMVLDSFPVSGTYTVTFPAGTRITLAAVARGSASDYAIEAMEKAGVTSGIVSMAGNVQTLGTKPDGSLWDVAIADPNNPNEYIGTIAVGQKALSTTNGNTCSFTDIGAKGAGPVYTHIIRPSSGYTVSNSIASITILSDDGTLADCLSTAMYVMGQPNALNYWRSYGKAEGESFEMIILTTNNEVVCTSGLMEQFTLTSRAYTLKYIE